MATNHLKDQKFDSLFNNLSQTKTLNEDLALIRDYVRNDLRWLKVLIALGLLVALVWGGFLLNFKSQSDIPNSHGIRYYEKSLLSTTKVRPKYLATVSTDMYEISDDDQYNLNGNETHEIGITLSKNSQPIEWTTNSGKTLRDSSGITSKLGFDHSQPGLSKGTKIYVTPTHVGGAIWSLASGIANGVDYSYRVWTAKDTLNNKHVIQLKNKRILRSRALLLQEKDRSANATAHNAITFIIKGLEAILILIVMASVIFVRRKLYPNKTQLIKEAYHGKPSLYSIVPNSIKYDDVTWLLNKLVDVIIFISLATMCVFGVIAFNRGTFSSAFPLALILIPLATLSVGIVFIFESTEDIITLRDMGPRKIPDYYKTKPFGDESPITNKSFAKQLEDTTNQFAYDKTKFKKLGMSKQDVDLFATYFDPFLGNYHQTRHLLKKSMTDKIDNINQFIMDNPKEFPDYQSLITILNDDFKLLSDCLSQYARVNDITDINNFDKHSWRHSVPYLSINQSLVKLDPILDDSLNRIKNFEKGNLIKRSKILSERTDQLVADFKKDQQRTAKD